VADAAAPLGKQVNRGVAWAAGAQAVIAVADMVSQLLVVALWVSASDLGIAYKALAFYPMLDSAADLGVTSSLIALDDHTPERVSTVFWMNLMVSGALFLLLVGVGPIYGWLQGHAEVGYLLIAYGGKLVFQNVYAIPFALLRKELRFADIAKARVAAHLAESIARVVFACMGLTVWCFTLAALTRVLVFGVIIQARHPFVPKLLFRPREVIVYVRFGLRSAASQILYQLYTNLDYPIVGYFFGDASLGIYTLAYSIVLEPVKTIANVVIDVAFPTFSRLRNDSAALVQQFLQFTRLNLIAVLPFVALVALIIPEVLHLLYTSGKWDRAQLDLCAEAARILCVVGVLRALGFIGPPLLDGVGRPERTLRYMVVATLFVPGAFLVGAIVLGGSMGFLSVAVAWAVGYPIAFAVLMFTIMSTIDLPVAHYARAAWGIVGSCAASVAVGSGISLALMDAGDLVRLVAISAGFLVTTGALLATWQKITPRSIAASLK
jgi:O-antigen/teichoic acid export membrane protein